MACKACMSRYLPLVLHIVAFSLPYSLLLIIKPVHKHKHASCYYFYFRKFFHDAIPSVTTAASASLMRELIKTEEISQADADLWLTSLALRGPAQF